MTIRKEGDQALRYVITKVTLQTNLSTLGFFLSVNTKIIIVSSTIPYIAKENPKNAKKKKECSARGSDANETELPDGLLLLNTSFKSCKTHEMKLFSLESTAEIINRNI